MANDNCLASMFAKQQAVCDLNKAFLPDPVVVETEEQMLEREQNVRDVLDTLGEYDCDAGMSVEDVSAIVNIKTLKGRLIAHNGCGEECGKEEECCWPVCSQV